MRKLAGSLLIGFFLIGLLGAPLPAAAVAYEDSFSNCNYPKTFDLAVMRPISFTTLLVSSVLFVPLGALALLTVPEDVGSVYNAMIGAPAAFTFNRRLGECQAIELSL
jgi:hypothetical protein